VAFQDAVKMNVKGTLKFTGPNIQSTELGGVTLWNWHLYDPMNSDHVCSIELIHVAMIFFASLTVAYWLLATIVSYCPLCYAVVVFIVYSYYWSDVIVIDYRILQWYPLSPKSLWLMLQNIRTWSINILFYHFLCRLRAGCKVVA